MKFLRLDFLGVTHTINCEKKVKGSLANGIDDQHGISFMEFRSFHLNDNYCLEYIKMGHYDGNYILICKDSDMKNFKVKVYLLIISCIFLILTITGYMILPELQNLYGKAVINYCLSLLFSFVFLCSTIFKTDYTTDICIFIGEYSSEFTL